MLLAPGVVTDLLDLILGRRCLTCDLPGRAWCATCLARCPRDHGLAGVPGLGVPVVCSTRYDAAVREAVVDFKVHGNRALAPMLGRLLADAVGAAVVDVGAASAILVPVPGHRRPARGFDALGAVVAHARSCARADGRPVTVVPALRIVEDRGPVKALGRARRRAAVHGSMATDRRRLRALASRRSDVAVIVVDDVVTTGATVTEACAALAEAGIAVDAVAAVARA